MSEHPPADRPANRLAQETSPYLLQHAHNPVDWYPWGDDAFARARAEDRPIFLSVGYSACHWCHVMERESFESDEIAALMNAHFVNVKVDREERPDVDQIYMAAVQAMTGHGGWPMSVFLTPEGQPFYGGTYYPPHDSRGMPGFGRVLMSVNQAWTTRRSEVLDSAGRMTEHLQELVALAPAAESESLSSSLLSNAARALARSFDAMHGGFGSAPKFPHPMDLRFLLRQHARTGDPHTLHIVRHTLDKMARGGIYDHLGGGFARYSTDARWLVPHFEKMLYDNALLTSAYVETFQVTGDPEFARVARETIDYVLGRMTDPAGGFYSTEDADSEGVEGKYYVWTRDEVERVLGPEKAKTFCSVYDVTAPGNWEHGLNILNQPKTWEQAARLLGRDESELRAELAVSRQALLEVRERRIPPGKDTKILTSWNGLMLAALADAGAALDEPRYLEAARSAADFLLSTLRTPEGALLHSYKDGRARFNGYLDDSANLIDGLTRLFEATGEVRWLDAAVDLAARMIEEFSEPDGGGSFRYTGRSHEALITRPKELIDNATPAANAMTITALLRLGALTGRSDLAEAGRSALRAVAGLIEKLPTAMGQSLIALDFELGPTREIAVLGGNDPEEFAATVRTIRQRFLPRAVLAPLAQAGEGGTGLPLWEGREAVGGRTTTYICEGFSCRTPIVGPEGLDAALADLGGDAASETRSSGP